MQTAGSGPDSPSAVIFATLPVTASGHPGNLGLTARRFGGGDIEATSMRHVLSTLSAMRSAGLVLAGALAVAGCAPEARYPLYSPLELAESFGYAEQQLSETGYRVSYSAPIRRTYAYGREKRQQQAGERLALAYDLALWRAAELALANGYPAFEVSDRDNSVQVDIRNEYYHHYPFFHHRHHFYGFYDRYAELAARVSIAVDFRAAPDGDRLDAEATLKRLRAKYPDAAGPAPAQG